MFGGRYEAYKNLWNKMYKKTEVDTESLLKLTELQQIEMYTSKWLC